MMVHTFGASLFIHCSNYFFAFLMFLFSFKADSSVAVHVIRTRQLLKFTIHITSK